MWFKFNQNKQEYFRKICDIFGDIMAEIGNIATLLPAVFVRSNNRVNLSFLTTPVGLWAGSCYVVWRVIRLQK